MHLKTTGLGDTSDVTDRDPCPSKMLTTSPVSRRTRADSFGLVGGAELDQQLAIASQAGRDPREQTSRGAADTDVAVEQQRGAPAAASGSSSNTDATTARTPRPVATLTTAGERSTPSANIPQAASACR